MKFNKITMLNKVGPQFVNEIPRKNSDISDGSYLLQYCAVLTASITFFITGIHSGWLAPSIPKLLSHEYAFEVTPDEASYIAIMSPIGHVIGGFMYSILSDKIGRKRTLLAISIPQILSFLLISLSFNGVYLLYMARIIGGISEGGSLVILPTYIAEITEPVVRGTMGIAIPISGLLGYEFVNVLGTFQSIYNTALICLVFPILLLATFSMMPESPYYYLMKNQENDAKLALQRLRRKDNVDKEIAQLIVDVSRQMSERGTVKDLFRIKANRRAFMIAALARTLQQWSGISAFASYFQVLLGESTDLAPVISTSIIICLQILVTIAASFYIDRIGRKLLFSMSSACAFVALASLATFFSLRDYTTVNIDTVTWIPIASTALYSVGLQAGMGVAIATYSGEIFSTSIKAKGMALLSVVNAASILATIKFYQFTGDRYGLAVPVSFFALCTFIGIWLYIFVFVETNGKTLEEIQQKLKGVYRSSTNEM